MKILISGSGGMIGSAVTLSLGSQGNEIFILNHPEISGPVNLVSPNPVTNPEFTGIFARTLKRPAVFRIPAFAVKAVFGEKGIEMILSSARVLPEKLLKAGFDFQYENLHKALKRALFLD